MSKHTDLRVYKVAGSLLRFPFPKASRAYVPLLDKKGEFRCDEICEGTEILIPYGKYTDEQAEQIVSRGKEYIDAKIGADRRVNVVRLEIDEEPEKFGFLMWVCDLSPTFEDLMSLAKE